ncbi:NapC/NirT cytochrome c family, N-terminal region, partial [Malonomonas rubra DSM 5091]
DSVFNKYMAKARDGFNHSMAMTFKTYGYNLRATDNAAKRIQDNCISCHGNIVSQMLENAKLYSKTESHVQMGRKCWDCHREVPHGITRNLTTTQANLVLD